MCDSSSNWRRLLSKGSSLKSGTATPVIIVLQGSGGKFGYRVTCHESRPHEDERLRRDIRHLENSRGLSLLLARRVRRRRPRPRARIRLSPSSQPCHRGQGALPNSASRLDPKAQGSGARDRTCRNRNRRARSSRDRPLEPATAIRPRRVPVFQSRRRHPDHEKSGAPPLWRRVPRGILGARSGEGTVLRP